MKYLILIMIVVSTISCSDNKNYYTDTNIKTIIQKSIDYKYFSEFLHPDVEGRELLCIKGVHVSEKLEMYNSNKTIKIISSQEDCENQIIVKLFEIKDNLAKVIFELPIEGIRSKLYLTLEQDEWVVVDDSSIVYNWCKPDLDDTLVVWENQP